MRPGVQGNNGATFNNIPAIVILEATACKFQQTVSNIEKKLPCGMPPVIIYRHIVPLKDRRELYPTSNCKTPVVQIDYRSSGEGI